MQFKVSPEAVALLEDRIEGWVAGLQLAALSLANIDFSNACVKKNKGFDSYLVDKFWIEST